MRLRKLEIVIAGLTLAFICFIGGYFTGMKNSVAIVSLESRNGETRNAEQTGLPGNATEAVGQETALNDTGVREAVGTSPHETPPRELSPPETAAEQPTSAVGIPRDSDGKININTASRSELTDLPGIGNVLAGRIVEYRTSNGSFKKIEDLRNVSGIGEKRFEAIKDRITVGN